MQAGLCPGKSGGEPAAVQALRDRLTTSNRAKRLDCGCFSTALAGAERPAIFHRPFRTFLFGAAKPERSAGLISSRRCATCLDYFTFSTTSISMGKLAGTSSRPAWASSLDKACFLSCASFHRKVMSKLFENPSWTNTGLLKTPSK